MYNRETLRKYLITNEGWRTKVYPDSLGIPTIGVGFNLRRPDARAKIEQMGLSFDDVLNGKVELRESQIDSLLNSDMEETLHVARRTFSDFDNIDAVRQTILMDMTFNLGPAKIAGFVKMIAAVKDKNWNKVAFEMQNSDWYPAVKRRGQWNVEAMRSDQLPNFEHEKPKESKEASERSEQKETKETSEGSENKETKEGSDGSETSERSEDSEKKEDKDRSEGSENSEDSEKKEDKDTSEGSERSEDSEKKEDKERTEGSERSEEKEGREQPKERLSDYKEKKEGSDRSEDKEKLENVPANPLYFGENTLSDNKRITDWFNNSI